MRKTETPKRPLPALAVLAALALAGCSGGNVGSSWQCPLAQGGNCDSVAGADPAVPQAASVPDAVFHPQAGRKPVPGKPLYLVRDRIGAEAPCRADCDGGFDPFGWLARLFGVDRKEDASSGPKPAPETAPAPAAAVPGGDLDVEAPAEPVTGALPAEPAPAPDDRGDDRRGDLRTEEVVARIWIAPFVDANGVYREAAHVRAVLEPAGWRVP